MTTSVRSPEARGPNAGLALMFVAIFLCSAIGAHAATCESPFFFETNPSLTLTDLAHFVPAEAFENPKTNNRFLNVQLYDEEDFPVKAGRRGVGVVYAGTGDLGVPGIGGRLWSRVAVEVDRDRTKALDKATGAVNVVFITKEKMGTCGRPTFKISFGQDGDIVANGRTLGKLE